MIEIAYSSLCTENKMRAIGKVYFAILLLIKDIVPENGKERRPAMFFSSWHSSETSEDPGKGLHLSEIIIQYV